MKKNFCRNKGVFCLSVFFRKLEIILWTSINFLYKRRKIYILLNFKGKKRVKSSMARSLPVENLLPPTINWQYCQLSTTCSNILQYHNGERLVAVDHNQLRTMTSETVDPIDWSQPPPSWTVPPVLHGVNAGLQIARLADATGARTGIPGYAKPTHCLCGHLGY